MRRKVGVLLVFVMSAGCGGGDDGAGAADSGSPQADGSTADAATGSADAAIPAGPRARYTFDPPYAGEELVPDLVGGFDGQNVGMSVDDGPRGSALAWTGDGQALVIPEETLDDLDAGTLALWLRKDDARLLRMFGKVDPGVSGEMGMTIDPEGRISFELDGALTLDGFPEAAFHHLAFTWGAEGKAIYLDGELATSSGGAAAVGSTATVSEFGRDPNRPETTGSRGALDEILVYDRELSAAEIATLAAD